MQLPATHSLCAALEDIIDQLGGLYTARNDMLLVAPTGQAFVIEAGHELSAHSCRPPTTSDKQRWPYAFSNGDVTWMK